MTIPRQIGPETGPRSALPDYSRSNATVERMVDALNVVAPGGKPRPRRQVRALFPRHATRDTVIRAVAAAILLGTALMPVAAMVLLLLRLEDGRAPGLGLMLVLVALGALALAFLALGLRFGIVALATARARVEVDAEGLLVVGAVGRRSVPWRDVLAVESRVIHPVHWFTAALRLRDGSRVIMPAFDRHVWTWSEPTGQDIRALRTELHRYETSHRPRI